MKPRVVLVQCSQVSLPLSENPAWVKPAFLQPHTQHCFSLIQEFQDWYLNSFCFWQPSRKKCHFGNSILPASCKWSGLVTRWRLQQAAGRGTTSWEWGSHCLQSGRWGSGSKLWVRSGSGIGNEQCWCQQLLSSLSSVTPGILTSVAASSFLSKFIFWKIDR